MIKKFQTWQLLCSYHRFKPFSGTTSRLFLTGIWLLPHINKAQVPFSFFQTHQAFFFFVGIQIFAFACWLAISAAGCGQHVPPPSHPSFPTKPDLQCQRARLCPTPRAGKSLACASFLFSPAAVVEFGIFLRRRRGRSQMCEKPGIHTKRCHFSFVLQCGKTVMMESLMTALQSTHTWEALPLAWAWTSLHSFPSFPFFIILFFFF